MSENPKILLVDDDRTFIPLVQEYLTAKAMDVVLCYNAFEGLEAFKSQHFDLCVLDVKMPMKDGFEMAAEIRELNALIPFIFLTAQTEKDDRIKGLNLGADDYVLKPFSMEELFLRIKAILRRVGIQRQVQLENPSSFRIGAFEFHPQSRELMLGEKMHKLTAIEAKLLELFLETETGLIQREQALKRVWGDEDSMRGRSLNVYVSKLRQILKADPNIEILNVHGSGYRLSVR